MELDECPVLWMDPTGSQTHKSIYNMTLSIKIVETNLCFRSQVWALDNNLLTLDLIAGLCSVVEIQEDTLS